MSRLPDDLPLRKEEIEKIDREYARMVGESRKACKDRDALFVELRRLRGGEPEDDYIGPWKGSSTTVDTLAAEKHQEVHAALRSAIRWKYFTFGITSPGNQSASDTMQVENWFNGTVRAAGWEKAASDVLYMACEQLAGIMYVGWTQELQHGHAPRYQEVDTGVYWFTEPEDYKRKPRKYRKVERPSIPDVIRTGLDFRSVNPWNLHTWPMNTIGLNERLCHCVFEDMWLSDADLVQGVDDFDYDEETVDWLLQNAEQAQKDEDAEVEGVQRRTQTDVKGPREGGTRRCVVVTGRLPVTDEGGHRIVDKERGVGYVDFEWTMCGKRTLRRVLSPHPVRPYAPVRLIRIPNSLWGDGVVSLTRWPQKEATAMRRGAHDMIDLAVNAPFIGPEHLDRMGGVKFAPGKYIGRQQGSLLEQIHVDMMAAQVALAEAGNISARGSSITSAQNVSSMSAGKVRKQSEVEFTSSIIKSKYELFGANVGTDFEEIAQIAMAQCAAHYTESDGEVVLPNGKSAAATAEQLTQRYRIVPQIRTDALNEDTRTNRTIELRNVLIQSPAMQARITAGDTSGVYELDKRIVEEMGEMDPEQLLGPEPGSQQAPEHQEGSETSTPEDGASPAGNMAQMIGGQISNGVPA